ncbi:MAG: hypothetical protein IKR71_06710 [Bacteroidales bacterium]|nr:hypothetical protein [Bacteroidales bacterium]
MKRTATLLLVLFMVLMTGLRAQITTIVTPKVQMFPSSGLTYLDDPMRYFNVFMQNTGPETEHVYVTITVSCSFSATGKTFSLETPNNMAPVTPLTISAGENKRLTYMDFKTVMAHITGRDVRMQGISWQDAMMLPEGNYEICVQPYKWDHSGGVPAPIPAGEPGCCYFTICYSGSAPEFTSPIIGQAAGNSLVINPRIDRESLRTPLSDADELSDSRAGSNYTTLTPTKKITFSWTGVLSNCINNSNLNYMFKLVEVTPQQTVQDAITQNRVIFAINAGSRTTCIIDTLTDLQIKLQRGHTYAAQVTAVAKDPNTVLRLGNDGKSQIIAFTWGKAINIQRPTRPIVTTDSSTSDNKDAVLKTIYNPYLISPVVDDDAADVLTKNYPEESSYRPANTLKLIDNTYYQINPKSDFRIAWMPLRGDSVTFVEYKLNLYEYIGGDVNYSTTRAPLKTYRTDKSAGNFAISNTDYIAMPEEWKSSFESGKKYFLVLEAAAHYKYLRTTTYTTTTTPTDGLPSTSTSKRYMVMSGTEFYYTNEIFQWGIDSGLLETVRLAQLSYPVDMTTAVADYAKDDLSIDEVYNDNSLKFKWSRAGNVAVQDTVTYNLIIAKLPKGRIPSQVKDTLLIFKNITDNEYMNDQIRDSLKLGEKYIAFVETVIKKQNKAASDYIIPNKGRSWRAAFKIVETEELSADLDKSVNCYADMYASINKKDTLRPKDIGTLKGKELKMNKFKVVFEDVQLKTDTIKDKKTKKVKTIRKSYYGTGYLVWHPFGFDTRIKVQLDSILFNKDYEIFGGCAKTLAFDNKSMLPMDFSGKIGEKTEKEINDMYKDIKDDKDCKEYLDAFNEMKGSYVSVGGLIGMGDKRESPAFYLPLRVNSQDFFLPSDGSNIMLTVNNMYFTPKTALMNLFALFYSHEDNVYIPMVATNICMDPDDFLAGADDGFDLYLAKSIEMSMKDGYKMRLKTASKLGSKDDGTVISFGKRDGYKRGGFQQLNLEFEMDINEDGLLGINPKSGVPQKDIPVKIRAMAQLQSWSNWLARVSMDAFALEDAPEISFVPGKGIWYDHSNISNPNKFPKDYKPTGSKDKAGNTWQGFFMEDLGVVLSDKISTAFGTAKDEKNTKSMYYYTYGANGQIKDSSEVSYTKGCLGFHAANIIIDSEGFTADFRTHDLLNAATDRAGGWAFSIDTLGLKVEKNKFKNGYINGTVQVPLMSGRLHYNCVVATDQLTFGLNTHKKDTLSLDIWAASLDIHQSYFKLVHQLKDKPATEQHTAQQQQHQQTQQQSQQNAGDNNNTAQNPPKPKTSIDLQLNGVININFEKIGIPVSFAAVKFEKLTLRNYAEQKDTNAKRVGDSDLWFYMGNWSKASPQHYLASDTHDEVIKGSIGNVFTYSVESIDGIIDKDGDKVKLGFQTVCKVGFKTGGETGDAFSLDATCGFKVWGKVNYKTWDVDKNDLGGNLDSIRIKTDCFSVFKLDGAIAWIGKESKDPTYGEGMFGTLKVTVMDKVTISMAAGFGTKDETKWWFFEGAGDGFKAGIEPLYFTGLGGGFAYNMTVKENAKLINAKAHELISDKTTGSLSSKLITGNLSECAYKPQKDSWVAKAGISMQLSNEKVMNADGILTLRVSKGKFSGILIDATAYVMSNVTSTASDQSAEAKNSNPLLVARTILGYEQNDDMHYFRLSLCVKGELDLANFIKDKAGANNSFKKLADTLNCMGKDIMKDVACAYDPTEVDKKGKGQEAGQAAGKQGSDTAKKDDRQLKLALTAQVPIDLEIKSYKKGHKPASCHSALGVDWYFSVGKPSSKEERVMFDLNADMIVCKATAEFTFYFITGNNFDYSLPPLDPEVQEFFYGEKKGKQAKSSDLDKVNNQGEKLVADFGGPKFEKAGGFAMGATFKAKVEFEFFLYVKVMAALGFDVALMDTKGQSCEGYDEIGKNSFYAMGQLYAMLQGSAGISINLGFWKGKLELCSLGMGALLKGGGPRPSWAFGLLRLKASVLNGLLSINTSVDFSVGHVCVPGAGDPLANVNFFESVSPGHDKIEDAKLKENLVEPFGGGVIVSNMPWNEEIILCSEEADAKGTSARRFIFVMEQSQCGYSYSEDGKKWIAANNDINITNYKKDNLIQKFEHKEGGFQASTLQKWHFTARAFEYREPLKKNGSVEKYYDVTTCKTKGTGTLNQCNWYDPKYDNDKDNNVHIFRQDTTIYIKTDAMPASLYNQVVYTWPYNGDPAVPIKAIEVNETQGGDIFIYMTKARPDLFNKNTLAETGKEMQAWALKGYGGKDGIMQCSDITYVTGKTNSVKIKMPANFIEKGKPYMVRMVLVNQKDYQSALDVVMQQQQVSTMSTYELTSQNWDQVYASHSFSSSTSSSGGKTNVTSDGELNIKVTGTGTGPGGLQIKHQDVVELEREGDIRHGREVGSLHDMVGKDNLGGKLDGLTHNLGGKLDDIYDKNHGTIDRTGGRNGKLINPTDNLIQGRGTSAILTDNRINEGVLKGSEPLLKGNGGGGRPIVKSVGPPAPEVDNSRVMMDNQDRNTQMANTNLRATGNTRSGVVRSAGPTPTGSTGGTSRAIRKTSTSIKTPAVATGRSGKQLAGTVSTGSSGNKAIAPAGSRTRPSKGLVGTRVSGSGVAIATHSNHFSGSVLKPTSSSQDNQQSVVDVSDYQFEKLKEDYTEQGKDTSMLYERTSLEKYHIACSIGDTIYDLCFKTDAQFSNYGELFENIMGAFNSGISSNNQQISTTKIIFPIASSTLQQKFNWYSYLFTSYTPDDPKRYNKGVTLPPIATFVIDTEKESRSHVMAKHFFLAREFGIMKAVTNSTASAVTKIPHQKSSSFPNMGKGANKGSYDDITCEYGKDFFNGTRGGIIVDPQAKWKNANYRLLMLNADERYIDFNYISDSYARDPNQFDELFRGYWRIPNMLEVSSDQHSKTPVITTASFEENSSKYEDKNGTRTSTVTVTITDYATPTMYQDIKMYYNFFQKCVNIAVYLNGRGYSYKTAQLKKLYTNAKQNTIFQFDNDFPYQITKATVITQYFHNWKAFYDNPSKELKLTEGNYNNYYHAGYLYFWYHHKYCNNYQGTKGMTVDQGKTANRVSPWYDNLNNLGKGDKTYVKIIYLDKARPDPTSYYNTDYGHNFFRTADDIADQINSNLAGQGQSIKDTPFRYNNTTSSHWPLNYKNVNTYSTFKTINDQTKALKTVDDADGWFE